MQLALDRQLGDITSGLRPRREAVQALSGNARTHVNTLSGEVEILRAATGWLARLTSLGMVMDRFSWDFFFLLYTTALRGFFSTPTGRLFFRFFLLSTTNILMQTHELEIVR